MPLPGGSAATASIMTSPSLSSWGAQQGRNFFLEFYDRFGALQPLLQPEVVPPRTRKFRRQRVWFGGLGAALGGAQRFEGARGALTPPVRQR